MITGHLTPDPQLCGDKWPDTWPWQS